MKQNNERVVLAYVGRDAVRAATRGYLVVAEYAILPIGQVAELGLEPRITLDRQATIRLSWEETEKGALLLREICFAGRAEEPTTDTLFLAGERFTVGCPLPTATPLGRAVVNVVRNILHR